jgi:hypothetical protein
MLLDGERERLVKLLVRREIARLHHDARAALAAELALTIQVEVVLDLMPSAAVIDVVPNELPSPSNGSVTGPLAENLDRLRLECGWSYDAMYAATGISKKLSIGHVHGKGVTPGNLKLYADAFAKALGRSITVLDLTGRK